MGHNADDKRVGLCTCWSSQDVSRVQEVLGDDTHGAVQLADPPAVDVVLLDNTTQNKQRGNEQINKQQQ